MNYHDTQAKKAIAALEKKINKFKTLAKKAGSDLERKNYLSKAEEVQQELDAEYPIYQMGTMYAGFQDTCNTRLLCEASDYARRCWVLEEMCDKDDSVIVGYESKFGDCIISDSFRPESKFKRDFSC